MAELRTALIGYGLAGRVIHRPLIEADPRMRVTHVVTGNPERQREAAADVPGVQVLSTVDELWRRADDVDVVVIATANDAHMPLATATLDLGKPTVVDKPLAITAADAELLCERARRLGVPLAVFHNRRWDSDTLAAQELITRGVLGRVIRLESRFVRYRPEVAQRWRERDAAGGGVLLDLGTHVVDQALHLLGPAIDVYAEVAATRAGAEVDDDCFLALTHASGARSHLWASMAAPVAGPRLLVQGTDGGWSKAGLDGQEDALRRGWTPVQGPLAEPPGILVDERGARDIPSLAGDWACFYAGLAAAVLDGAALPVPADAGVTVLRILEAARRSSRRRQVVALR